MKKNLSALLILILFATASTAQAPFETLELTVPKFKPEKTLYSRIGFLDSRQDTSCIGILDSGQMGNTILKLLTPVQPQLELVLQAYTGQLPGSGELLLQLKRLSFAETEKARYCYLNAALYAKGGERYSKLSDLDVTIPLTSSNVKKELSDEANQVLDKWISQALLIPAADSVTYSADELRHLDEMEKSKIPLYAATSYPEGLYSDYVAFMTLKPDLRGEVRTRKDGSISSLNIHDAHWKEETKKHIYAVVYHGAPYVVTHFGYYPLKKAGNDFYFTGKLRVTVTNTEKMAAKLAMGELIGSAIAVDRETCVVLIDHVNGQFIHLKVLADN
jgi:hypothetical protein